LPLRFTAVLRGLERNRRRSASTALGVAMALALVLVAWIMLDSTNEWLADAGEVNRYDARVVFDGPVDDRRIDEVDATPGVIATETARVAPVSIRVGSGRYESTVVGFTPGTTMHRFDASAGRADRVPRRGVVVGGALRTSPYLELDVGDVVELTFADGASTRQPVVGFVDEPIGTYVYASEANLATWDPQSLSSALVRFDSGADRGASLHRLTGLPGVIAVEDNDSVIDAMREYMQLIYVLIGMMLVFGAAMASGLLFTTMSVNVAERSVELATLRASGVEHRRLSRLVTGENVLLTALGIAPGILLGIWLARSFLSVYTNDLWHLDLVVRPSSLALAGVAVIVTALVAQRPALRAVRRLATAEVVRTRST
jgi:putative ABC transport system permease protein